MSTRHSGSRQVNRMMTCHPDAAFVDLTPTAGNDAFAVLLPFWVFNQPLTFEWFTGAVGGGNFDVGIYSSDGTAKLWSLGSTAVPGTNQAVTAVVGALSPLPNELKDVWLALALDTVTTTFKGVTLLHTDLGVDYDNVKTVGRFTAKFPLPQPLGLGGIIATTKKPLLNLRSV